MISYCQATRIYFVRHAEKAAAPVGDPGLSSAGKGSIVVLAGLLRDKSIEGIYVTETCRSREMAEPFSACIGLPQSAYSHDTVHQFLFNLLVADRNALVSGHSHTVLTMVQELGLKSVRNGLGKGGYDGFWVVSTQQREGCGGFRLSLRERSYGANRTVAAIASAGLPSLPQPLEVNAHS